MTVRFQGRMRSVVNQLDGFPGGIGKRGKTWDTHS